MTTDSLCSRAMMKKSSFNLSVSASVTPVCPTTKLAPSSQQKGCSLKLQKAQPVQQVQTPQIDVLAQMKKMIERFNKTCPAVPRMAGDEDDEEKAYCLPGTDCEYRTPGACFRNKQGHVKRPMNAFMVWARENREKISRAMPDATNSEVSIILGQMWVNLPDDEKARFYRRATQIKLKHREDFPDWVFKPSQSRKSKESAPPPTQGNATKHIANGARMPAASVIPIGSQMPRPVCTVPSIRTPIRSSLQLSRFPVYLQRVECIPYGQPARPRSHIMSFTKEMLVNKLSTDRIEMNSSPTVSKLHNNNASVAASVGNKGHSNDVLQCHSANTGAVPPTTASRSLGNKRCTGNPIWFGQVLNETPVLQSAVKPLLSAPSLTTTLATSAQHVQAVTCPRGRLQTPKWPKENANVVHCPTSCMELDCKTAFPTNIQQKSKSELLSNRTPTELGDGDACIDTTSCPDDSESNIAKLSKTRHTTRRSRGSRNRRTKTSSEKIKEANLAMSGDQEGSLSPGQLITGSDCNLSSASLLDTSWPFPFPEEPSDSWIEGILQMYQTDYFFQADGGPEPMYKKMLESRDPLHGCDWSFTEMYPGGLYLDVDKWNQYLDCDDSPSKALSCFEHDAISNDIHISPVPLRETLARFSLANNAVSDNNSNDTTGTLQARGDSVDTKSGYFVPASVKNDDSTNSSGEINGAIKTETTLASPTSRPTDAVKTDSYCLPSASSTPRRSDLAHLCRTTDKVRSPSPGNVSTSLTLPNKILEAHRGTSDSHTVNRGASIGSMKGNLQASGHVGLETDPKGSTLDNDDDSRLLSMQNAHSGNVPDVQIQKSDSGDITVVNLLLPEDDVDATIKCLLSQGNESTVKNDDSANGSVLMNDKLDMKTSITGEVSKP